MSAAATHQGTPKKKGNDQRYAPQFEMQLLRLKQELGMSEDQHVAQALGMTKAAFSDRKRRNAFPEDKLFALAAKHPEFHVDVQRVLTGKPTWKPSDGYIAGPEDHEGDDHEGGIDITLSDTGRVLAELGLEVDIAAALDAWNPDDWFNVHGTPPAGSFLPEARLHTFLFPHEQLLRNEPAPAGVVLPQDC